MKRKIEVKGIENNVYYKMNPILFCELIDLVNSSSNISFLGKVLRKDHLALQ